jgi:hypothetical protein
MKARQMADWWLNIRRYNLQRVSIDEAIQFPILEYREPLVERVLTHRMVVLLTLRANCSLLGSGTDLVMG